VQVWWNGSVNNTYEFGLVSYKRGHFVSPLKRQPQNAPAGIASCAKKEDFHNRTSSLTPQAINRSRTAPTPAIPRTLIYAMVLGQGTFRFARGKLARLLVHNRLLVGLSGRNPDEPDAARDAPDGILQVLRLSFG
jgi:hypothetical protein